MHASLHHPRLWSFILLAAAIYALLGRVPVREPPLAARAQMAPLGWAAPGSIRTAGWTFRALDDPLLSLPGGRQRPALCTAALVRIGHGPVHHPWIHLASGGGMSISTKPG